MLNARQGATENEEAATNISDSTDEDEETESNEDESSTDKPFTASAPSTIKQRKTVLSTKLAATLDCTNTSVQNATMIMASVINACDSCLSHSLLSKSTVYRCRQNLRKEAAQHIIESYEATTSVVHWDGKLIWFVSTKFIFI